MEIVAARSAWHPPANSSYWEKVSCNPTIKNQFCNYKPSSLLGNGYPIHKNERAMFYISYRSTNTQHPRALDYLRTVAIM